MSLNLDNKTIYEIFRGCRLCGAGGGYKMPIIPSVVGFDCADIDLRQKIRECVQIEVNQDDKMPPLICELCVDKVNEFYEFLDMCRNTNVKTRKRLGLPDLQAQNSSEADNCILGVTEPVYQQDEDDEPLQRTSRPGKVKVMVKKEDKKVKSLQNELEKLIKQERVMRDSRDSRSSRGDRSDGSRASRGKPSPSPPARETRQSVDQASRLKVIEIEDDDENFPLVPPGKRTRDRGKDETPIKKLKITLKVPPPELPPPSKTKPRPGPKCSKPVEAPLKPTKPPSPAPKPAKTPTPPPKPFKRPSSPPSKLKPHTKSVKIIPTPLLIPKSKLAGPKSARSLSPSVKKTPLVGRSVGKGKGAPVGGDYSCGVCASVFQSGPGIASHMRATHSVRFTSNDLACNPCGEWFSSSEEVAAHHKQHRSKNKPYTCRGCGEHCRSLQAYTNHAAGCARVPWTELPDVECAHCCRLFPTRALLASHRCKGDAGGGKCRKCNRPYATAKTRQKHESSCTSKKKGSNPLPLDAVPASLRRRLLPASVRVARCDERLGKNKRGRYDVGGLSEDFGLDPRCVYPYRAFVRVKQEPLSCDGMVSINKDVRDEFYIEEDYVHWDSDNSSSDEEFSLINPTQKMKKVPSLTTLTLKTIFSKRCLGKVPRKLRKVKDKFDSFFNPEGEFDNVQSDINSIIDNLGDENDGRETLCGFSLSDIKLTDVKSISEIENIGAGDNEVNGETNYDSDSLLENNSEVVGNDDKGKDDDNTESNGIVNSEQTSFNIVNKHLMNAALDTGSETDASVEDNVETQGTKQSYDEKDTASENSLNMESQNTKQDYDEKDTLSENSLNIEPQTQEDTKQNYDEKDAASENNLNIGNNHLNNTENLQNGNTLRTETSIENKYDVTENPTDLINEIEELYDKKLMDELDAQIDDKGTNLLDKSEKILLEDLVPDKDVGLGLDNISDEEFNFDA